MKDHIFALDLGTTKFCLAALTFRRGQELPLVTPITVPARGMKRGMLADFNEAQSALHELLGKAEAELNVEIRKVVVGIAGSHLEGRRLTKRIAIPEAPIEFSELKKLIQTVETEAEREFREILHTVPIGYRVDQREQIDNPVGFSGRFLEGEFFIIDADRPYLKDVVRLCNQCGLEVQRLYSEPFASASVTVTEAEKQAGIAIADIGGGTTDGIVFQKGTPVSAFTINIAGMMMTKDIAVALSLSQENAEKAKIFFGLEPSQKSATLEIDDLMNRPKVLSSEDLYPVLGARIYELATHLAHSLKEFKGQLGGGILLTGGGSEVQGICDFLNRQFKLPVQKATPLLSYQRELEALTSTHRYPSKYATAFGLLNLEYGRQKLESQGRRRLWPTKYLNHFVNWIKDLS